MDFLSFFNLPSPTVCQVTSAFWLAGCNMHIVSSTVVQWQYSLFWLAWPLIRYCIFSCSFLFPGVAICVIHLACTPFCVFSCYFRPGQKITLTIKLSYWKLFKYHRMSQLACHIHSCPLTKCLLVPLPIELIMHLNYRERVLKAHRVLVQVHRSMSWNTDCVPAKGIYKDQVIVKFNCAAISCSSSTISKWFSLFIYLPPAEGGTAKMPSKADQHS